jgi:hypothetical protein
MDDCLYPARIRALEQRSTGVLGSLEDFDFIFVDGNHDIKSVAPEVEHLMRRRPLCVMAHDTNNTKMGRQLSEGALHLKETFMAQPDYLCIEDCTSRFSEETDRGLFFATTNATLCGVARDVYAKWCQTKVEAVV